MIQKTRRADLYGSWPMTSRTRRSTGVSPGTFAKVLMLNPGGAVWTGRQRRLFSASSLNTRLLAGREHEVIRYTSPYCDVIRAKIILLTDEGLPNHLIAAKLDTPRQIVSKWRKRFALSRLPRPGGSASGRA